MGSHLATVQDAETPRRGICRRMFRALAPALIAVSIGMAPVNQAGAQDVDAVVQRMIALNRQALTAFAANDLDGARNALVDAIRQGRDGGLAEDKMMARTYLHLGAVYLDGFNDRPRAMRFLGLALRIRPDIPLTPSLVTPTLQQAFADAKKEAQNPAAAAGAPPAAQAEPPAPRPSARPSPPPAPVADRDRSDEDSDEPDLPATIPVPLYCPNPDEAPPEESIFLRCVTRGEVLAARVLLFYRVPGEEKFTERKMSRSPGGWWGGTIPARAATGKLVQYYVEARDGGGREAASNGRSDSPNLMLIRDGVPQVSEDSVAGTRPSRRRRRVAADEENPIEEQQRERSRGVGVHRRAAHSFWLGLGLGSGYGWHGATRLEFRTDLKVDAGPASSGLLYFAPEVGYQFTDYFGISIQGRHQFIPEQKSDFLDEEHLGAPAHGAHAILGKVSYFAGSGNVQLMVSGIIGGGDGFRLVIPPAPTSDPATSLPRSDTVRGGPGVAGAGLSLLYHFGPHATIVLDVKGLTGFPDAGRVVDFGLGMQFGL
jgi:hypothetical protein